MTGIRHLEICFLFAILSRKFPSLGFPSARTEVMGQDSTLYLRPFELIISQTFHYMNQPTASHNSPVRFPPALKIKRK